MMNTLALLLIVQYMYGCIFLDDHLFNQLAVVFIIIYLFIY